MCSRSNLRSCVLRNNDPLSHAVDTTRDNNLTHSLAATEATFGPIQRIYRHLSHSIGLRLLTSAQLAEQTSPLQRVRSYHPERIGGRYAGMGRVKEIAMALLRSRRVASNNPQQLGPVRSAEQVVSGDSIRAGALVELPPAAHVLP